MSAQRAPIESIIAVEAVPGEGAGVFQNANDISNQQGHRSLFGGVLISQAISAASHTVPPDYVLASSQSSFVRAASGHHRIRYAVERVSDTRSFLIRLVRAYRGNDMELCYLATLTFQNRSAPARSVLEYGLPPPHLGGLKPDDIPKAPSTSAVRWSANGAELKEDPVMDAFREPCDWRRCEFTVVDDPTEFRMNGFVRSPDMADDSRNTHMAAVGYMSDSYILGPPIYGNPDKTGRFMEMVALALSLSHNMVFHDIDARADQWMVCERKTSWAGDGRALIHHRVWNVETGRLVMSCTQESVIRLSDVPTKL